MCDLRLELYLPHHPSLRRRIAEERCQDRLRGAGINATVAFLARRGTTERG
jgi:hypothetical protein